MKRLYRGFRIEVKREKALGGWDQIQYYVERLRDGWIYKDGFHMGDYGTLLDVVNEMRAHVDVYLDHPETLDDAEVSPEDRERREREFWEAEDATMEELGEGEIEDDESHL